MKAFVISHAEAEAIVEALKPIAANDKFTSCLYEKACAFLKIFETDREAKNAEWDYERICDEYIDVLDVIPVPF